MHSTLSPSTTHLLGRDRIVLFVLVLAGVALRTLGNGHGLPWITEPDDENVRIALGMAQGITPLSALLESSRYPHLLLYLMWLCDGLFIASDAPVEHAAAAAIQVGRSLSGVLAAIAIAPTFWIARRLAGRRAAWCAATLLCFDLLSNQHGHLAKPHAPLLAFSTFALWFATRHALDGRVRDLMLASVFGCMSGAMIHSGFVAFGGIAAAACVAPLRPRLDGTDASLALGQQSGPSSPSRLRRLATAAVVLALAVVAAAGLGYPNAVATAFQVAAGAADAEQLMGPHNVSGIESLGLEGLMGPATTLRDYFPLVGPFGLAALVFFMLQPRKNVGLLPLAATTALFFAVFGHVSIYAARFMLPIVPCFLIAAAVALERIATRITPRFATLVVTLGTLVLGGWTAAASCRLTWLHTREDTRQIAADWIEQNVPVDAVIAATPYLDMPLFLDSESLADHQRIVSATTSWTRIQRAQIASGFDPHADLRRRVWFPFKDAWRALPGARLNELRARQVRYGLSLFDNPVQRVSPGYEVFRNFGDIVFSIDPGPKGFTGADLYNIPFPLYWVWIMERSGPAIEIVKLH